MAKREVIDCDKCGKECATHIHIDIPNGITRETGGHTTEIYHEYEKKDLCSECAGKLLGYMFRMKKKDTGVFDPKASATIVYTDWIDGRNVHPSHQTNDAVALALKWFGIKPKE